MIPKGTLFKYIDDDENVIYFKFIRDNYFQNGVEVFLGQVIYNSLNKKVLQFSWFEKDLVKQLTEEEIHELNKLIIFSS